MPNATTKRAKKSPKPNVQQERSDDAIRRILEAGHRVIADVGVAKFSLRAVADAAGLSKSGLLHHFSSKKALLKAMLEQMMESFETSVNAMVDGGNDTTEQDWVSAYINASLNTKLSLAGSNIAVAAALAYGEDLHQIYENIVKKWNKKISVASGDAAIGEIVRLAVDGFWWNYICDSSPMSAALRKQVAQRLCELLRKAS